MLPPRLQKILTLFSTAPKDLRIQALLDYSRRVPPLPDDVDAGSLEQVHECQTPFFLHTRLDDEGRVRIFFESPPESPTVRGYAGILHEGLDGETPEAILAIPNDFYLGIGLEEVVTPQRLNGMGAIIARLKRQVGELAAA
ncbi:MAG: SufE family protein [Acidimicrobiia bacterium]